MEMHKILLWLGIKIAASLPGKRVPDQKWAKKNCFQASELLNSLKMKLGISKNEFL